MFYFFLFFLEFSMNFLNFFYLDSNTKKWIFSFVFNNWIIRKIISNFSKFTNVWRRSNNNSRCWWGNVSMTTKKKYKKSKKIQKKFLCLSNIFLNFFLLFFHRTKNLHTSKKLVKYSKYFLWVILRSNWQYVILKFYQVSFFK